MAQTLARYRDDAVTYRSVPVDGEREYYDRELTEWRERWHAERIRVSVNGEPLDVDRIARDMGNYDD